MCFTNQLDLTGESSEQVAFDRTEDLRVNKPLLDTLLPHLLLKWIYMTFGDGCMLQAAGFGV